MTENALRKMYDGKCTVIEYRKMQKPNKSTTFGEFTVHTDIPCRLSFSGTNATSASGVGGSVVVQPIKLFLDVGYNINPGSKIIVTQNDVTTEYKSSGKPSIYASHQEISLELFDGWA